MMSTNHEQYQSSGIHPDSPQTSSNRPVSHDSAFMLTFSLHLWFSAVAFLQGKLGDFSPALTWSTLVFQALSSPYMVLTLPIMLGGLWIYQRPLNVCSTLYAVLTGCAYFVVALICSYIAIGYVV